MSEDTKLTGNAYVTVYHTVNVTVGMGWLAIPALAVMLALAWKAVAS